MCSRLKKVLAGIFLFLLFFSFEAEAQSRKLFVVTSDYETGGHAVINLDSLSVDTIKTGSLPSDAYVRSFGEKVYVVGRFMTNNVNVFDRNDFERPANQYSTGAGTHPHDILVLNDSKAYLTMYDKDYISIIHPMTGSESGRIDMSVFSDSDGLPEIDRMLYHDGRVYITAQRLDRDNYYEPTDFSVIAIVDPETDTVLDSIELSRTNPVDMQYVRGVDKIMVAEAGGYFSMVEGGLEYINPVTKEAEGILMTKDDFGGTLGAGVLGRAIEMVNSTQGYGLITDADYFTSIVKFDLGSMNVEPIHNPQTGFIHSDILLDGDYLFVADRTMEKPGIRVFDVRTNVEITSEPIDVGLPPACMVIVEHSVIPPCPMEEMFAGDEEKLSDLRNFRDNYLVKTAAGRMFVDFYYNNADMLNSVLNSNPYIQKSVKQIIELMVRK